MSLNRFAPKPVIRVFVRQDHFCDWFFQAFGVGAHLFGERLQELRINDDQAFGRLNDVRGDID